MGGKCTAFVFHRILPLPVVVDGREYIRFCYLCADNKTAMGKIKKLGIFCGSASGKNPVYAEKAAAMGKLMVQKKLTMVYGGGNIGLMGVIADSMTEAGGKVIGVITEHLCDVELAHQGIAQLDIVRTMSERKELVIDYSDAFVVMPGGYGTLDEFFEVITLVQLNLIRKPVGIFNVDGFFDGLLKMLCHVVKEGFVRQEHMELFVVESDEHALLEKLSGHRPVETAQWLENFKDEKY
jgi:uncharacterized protein (TIGR00730 family)